MLNDKKLTGNHGIPGFLTYQINLNDFFLCDQSFEYT